MPAFPTLSRGVDVSGISDKIAVDPTIRSEMANGVVKTRPRFTATKREFHFGYRFLPAADIALLKTFEETTVLVGSISFTWTNPFDSESYTVKMLNPIDFQPEPTDHSTMAARLDFIEA